MSSEDVKIYSAAKHTAAPKLPLREELDIVAIECVYEPKEKKKALGGLLLRTKKKRNQSSSDQYSAISKNGKQGNKSFWSSFKKGDVDDDFSDSVVSAITMHTLVRVTDNQNKDSDRASTLGTETNTVTNSNYSEGDLYSEDETEDIEDMDDMTISIAALVGNENIENTRPAIIFTSANDDGNDSTKWWYEKEEENSEDDIHGRSSICDCIDMESMVVSVQSVFSISKKYDLDSYDLKLEVENEDSNSNHMSIESPITPNTMDRHLMNDENNEAERRMGGDSDQLSIDEERNPIEYLALTPDRKSSRNLELFEKGGDSSKDLQLKPCLSLESDGTKHQILGLKTAQLAKYKVAQSTLEDDFIDKDEADSIYKKMMNHIASLGDEIEGLPVVDDEADEDLFNGVDNSIADVEDKIAKHKIKLSQLVNEQELDVY